MNTLFADNNLFRRVGSIALARQICESINEYEANNKERLSLLVKYIKFERIILSSSLAKSNLTSIIKRIKKRQKQAKILIINEFESDVILYSGLNNLIDSNIYVSESLINYQSELESFLSDSEYKGNDGLQEMTHTQEQTARITNPFDELSHNEYIIVNRLIIGERVSQIADSMQKSISAISTYKSRAFKKLSVENISQLKKLHETIFFFKDKLS